jgi:hypothetical protein
MKTLADIRQSINESADINIPRGRLNIPRHQMPQITGSDYPEFLELMRLRGVSYAHRSIAANTLKAAQKEVNIEKVHEWMKSLPEHAANKPCIVSRDGYVLDGNHTWLAKLNSDPGCNINCIQIDLDIEELINTSKLFHKVTNKTVNEGTTMLFDLPESLISKVRKVIGEDTEKKKVKKKHKEEITFNPEIRPDRYTEPYKIKTKNAV